MQEVEYRGKSKFTGRCRAGFHLGNRLAKYRADGASLVTIQREGTGALGFNPRFEVSQTKIASASAGTVIVVMAQFLQSLPDFLVDNSKAARLIALRAQQPVDSAGDVFQVVPGPPVHMKTPTFHDGVLYLGIALFIDFQLQEVRLEPGDPHPLIPRLAGSCTQEFDIGRDGCGGSLPWSIHGYSGLTN